MHPKTTFIRTWEDLLNYLTNSMTQEQRQQPAQFYLGNGMASEREELLQPVSIASVETMFTPEVTRAWNDNEHHPEYHVLILDHNPHSEDGDTAWTLLEGGKMRGNKTGKIIDIVEECSKRKEKREFPRLSQAEKDMISRRREKLK